MGKKISITCGIILLVACLFYWYANRMEYMNEVKYNRDTFILYKDWHESTGNFDKLWDPDYKHIYVIKKNRKYYLKFSYGELVGEDGFMVEPYIRIEGDSLVLSQGDDFIYYRMPANLPSVSVKNIRVYKIYRGAWANGSRIDSSIGGYDVKTTDFLEIPVNGDALIKFISLPKGK
ncbi:hypothetical protein [uncultured Acetobacteroides sp.]|uniref:hypothetical protein n=1 Tax=uncultured Acetobacteroides sp. TaxID=1760811 RepID=UPI0029F54082|nr:hypothetical protein [uncultured Acetobacteroides sp.]